jgi:hypothetical protein
LDETIWSLTSPLVKRISGSKKFRSSSQKDFCNNIGAKQTTGGDHKRIDLARAFELAGRSLMGAMGWRLTARTIP